MGKPLSMDPGTELILEVRLSWSHDKGLSGTSRSGQHTRRKWGLRLVVYGLVLKVCVDTLNQPLWLQQAAYDHCLGSPSLCGDTAFM